MATINAGELFPAEIANELWNAVRGHSTIAKLSQERPVAFTGTQEWVFRAADEVAVVAEGAAKPAGSATMQPVVVKPLKYVYQQRFSDEFMKSAEGRIPVLEGFFEAMGRKMARGLDIVGMHAIDPRTKAAVSAISIDGEAGSITTHTAGQEDAELNTAIAAVQGQGYDVTGIALAPSYAQALGSIKANGILVYPEFGFGRNPEEFYGMRSDVNGTISLTYTTDDGTITDHAIVGDWSAIRWGYAQEVGLEVIEYGDPDQSGSDLKAHNEVLLRAEAYIGVAVLDGNAFALVQTVGA